MVGRARTSSLIRTVPSMSTLRTQTLSLGVLTRTLKLARRGLEGTLAGFGYDLTLEELRLVENLRCRTAALSDEQLARTLASGLRERTGTLPAQPAAPSWHGAGPGRPARPGG